jgi:hypothetical protein
MTLKKCTYTEDFTRRVVEGESNNREYPIAWKAISVEHDLTGTQVLAQARAAGGTPGPNFDPVPDVGDPYSLLTASDPNSRCKTVTCELEDPKGSPHIWIIKADFGPPEGGNLKLVGPSPPPSPLKWPSRHKIEYIESQSVVEKAYCLTQLKNIARGMLGNRDKEPGPLLNSAGQQTIDPQMELDHRIILHTTVYYPDPIYAIALNNQFHKTCHGPPAFLGQHVTPSNPVLATFPNIDPASGPHGGEYPFFMGCPHFSWKFLNAQCADVAFRKVDEDEMQEEEEQFITDGVMQYYLTTIRHEFKLGEKIIFGSEAVEDINPEITDPAIWGDAFGYSGWIRLVLNNGQTCFRKMQDLSIDDIDNPLQEVFIIDPRFDDDRKLWLPTTAQLLKEEFNWKYADTRAYHDSPREQPTDEDFTEELTSEPVNLNLDGTQIMDPNKKP